jgi:hypothetical protein
VSTIKQKNQNKTKTNTKNNQQKQTFATNNKHKQQTTTKTNKRSTKQPEQKPAASTSPELFRYAPPPGGSLREFFIFGFGWFCFIRVAACWVRSGLSVLVVAE